MSADDRFTAFLNGRKLGSHQDWPTGKTFPNLAAMLAPGKNLLAIEAENLKAPVPQNPAGLIGTLVIEFADGTHQTIETDATWLCAKEGSPGWNGLQFEEASWVKAMALGQYGMGPWGNIGAAGDEVFGPQAAGIPGVVRMIYAPEAEAVQVFNLGRNAVYAASWFDPVNGTKTTLGEVRVNEDGSWQCPPPAGHVHDWVLILEPKAIN